MIKISLQAIIKLLINNGYAFQIEKANFEDNPNIVRFVVSQDYPKSVFISFDISMSTSMMFPRTWCAGNVMCYYDINSLEIIGICQEWRTLIDSAKKQATEKIFQPTHT